MDGQEKLDFLASIDKELETEKAGPTTSTPNPRRLSASGAGIALRRRSREEVGDTPQKLSLIRPPPSLVPDLGESFLTNPPPDPSPKCQTPVIGPSRLHITAPDVPPTSEPTPSPPRTNRSGRKRPFPADSTDKKQKKKMAGRSSSQGRSDDEDPFAKLAKMMKSIESKIEQSEVRMATKIDSKIDSLASTLGARIERTEQELAKTREEMREIKAVASEENISRMVSMAVEAQRPAEASREPGRRPRAFRTTADRDAPDFSSTPVGRGVDREAREERYLLARRQLRLWPVDQDDLEAGVGNFLCNRLLVPKARLAFFSFTVKPIESRSETAPKDQALVTFETARQRDEIKAKAVNLRGSDGVGCQMEPPDHLRTQYQAFQSLAYCLKKKTPELRRNIKFDDRDQALIMDVKTADGWKTIEYDTAKNLLRKKSGRSESISRNELRNILSTSDVVNSDTSMSEDEETVVLNVNTPNNRSCCLSFLNTNARSLGPKITSLADCFEEKLLDVATVTETWFQSDRLRQELEQELVDKYSLSMVSRERSRAAINGRQYGGVAVVYRKKRCKFEPFTLVNPMDHEVLALVGKIVGIKGKVFYLSCYAPPNLTLQQGRDMIEYVSDVIGEAKRTFANCTIIVNGDFNQWPFEEILEDHPDLKEVEHEPTRAHRKIDRLFTNFSRAIEESYVLPPLETEAGSLSDHKMVYVRAKFPQAPKNTVTYTYRKYTEQGALDFEQQCQLQDWNSVLAATGSENKVEAFDKIIPWIHYEKQRPVRSPLICLPHLLPPPGTTSTFHHLHKPS